MNELTLDKARVLFNTAHLNKEDCSRLIELTKDSEEPVLKAYLAAARMVETKYFKNPFVILKQFNAERKLLDEYIVKHPNNPELRYLRYTIQVNTPAFVGYNQHKKEDRLYIHEFLMKQQPSSLTPFVLEYLKDTNDVWESEKGLF